MDPAAQDMPEDPAHDQAAEPLLPQSILQRQQQQEQQQGYLLTPTPASDAALAKAARQSHDDHNHDHSTHGHWTHAEFLGRRSTTCVLINLISIMERMDEQVLPAVSRFIGCTFHAKPHQLGEITFWRALVQALASPIGGIAGHFVNRVLVMTVGACIWGFCTFCFAFTRTVYEGMFFWAFNGIGLSLMIPNAQSLIADYFPSSSRGTAFGALALTGALGGMFGSVYATNIGAIQPMGIPGWRFAFLSVALVSFTIGLLTFALGSDPRCQDGKLFLEPHSHVSNPNHTSALTPTSSNKQQQHKQRQQRLDFSPTNSATQILLPAGRVPTGSPQSSPQLLGTVEEARYSLANGNAGLADQGLGIGARAQATVSSVQRSQQSASSAANGSGRRMSQLMMWLSPRRDGCCATTTTTTAAAAAAATPLPLGKGQHAAGVLQSQDLGSETKQLALEPADADSDLEDQGLGPVPSGLQGSSVLRNRRGATGAAGAEGGSGEVYSSNRTSSSSGCISRDIKDSSVPLLYSAAAGSTAAGPAAKFKNPVLGAEFSEFGDPLLVPELLPARSLTSRLVEMVTMPTFLIIILQGIVGSMPWNGLVFLTLYLQLMGMSDFAASLLMAILLGGTAFGGLLGGWIGDRVAMRYPNHGRIAVVQFSVGVGVPLSWLILKGLPMNGDLSTVILYGVLLTIFGLLTSWAAPACNNPIFAEIVPADMRNIVYAFDRSFEGAISAMGAPLVGWVAEQWFGFHGDASTDGCDEPEHLPSNGAIPRALPSIITTSGLTTNLNFRALASFASLGSGGDALAAAALPADVTSEQAVVADLSKAQALGSAMLLVMVVPWALCTLFYTGLHWTYPRDHMRATVPRVATATFASHILSHV